MLLLIMAAAQAASAPPVTSPPPLGRPAPPPPIMALPPVNILRERPAQELFETAVKPRGPVPSWISNDDYPASSIRNGKEGMTAVALTVTPEGRVDGCFVETSAGDPMLDFTTCRLLTSRARFEPGRDQDGRAVPSALSIKIAWRLPQASSQLLAQAMPRIPLAPWASTVTFEVEQGAIVRCTEERAPPAPVFVNNCQTPGAVRTALSLAPRGGKPGSRTTIQFFTRLSPYKEWTVGTPPKGTPLVHYVADLEIDEQGNISNCVLRKAVAPKGAIPSASPDCRKIFAGRYTVARRVSDNVAVPNTAMVEVMMVRAAER